jgi:hypothetical protein
VCWDDALISIGTEVGSIELYSIKKILMRAEQAQREQKSENPADNQEFRTFGGSNHT